MFCTIALLTSLSRSFSSTTTVSTPVNNSVWNSPAEFASQISTPSTEYSLTDEVFNFDHCRIEGCHATFSGETLDVRKGNHTRHMNSKHGGERFYCNAFGCLSSYNRDDNLLNHKRKRHPDQDLPPPKRRHPSNREESSISMSAEEVPSLNDPILLI
jgi:hypothetical protein